MKAVVAAARFLDRYAGLAACLLLSALPRGVRGGLPASPKKILVLKFWEGGLIVMGAPWYRALKRRYPGAEVRFLTLDVNAQLCGMLGAADGVSALRVSAGLPAFFADLLRALPALRAEKFDLVLDLEFFSRFSAVVTALVGGRFSVGFGGGPWRGRSHDALALFDGKAHMTANYAAFFSEAGVTAGPQDERPLEAAAEVPGLGPQPKPLAVLNFDRKDIMPERAWPRENYEAVLDRVLAGGRFAAAAISQRRVDLPEREGLVNLTGKLDYRQLAALFARAAVFVTHDSGPLHIAAAMGCPTVSVFGPETPAGYAPLGPRHRALYLGLPCSPCIDALKGKELVCVRRSNECVTGVTPEMVLKAMDEVTR